MPCPIHQANQPPVALCTTLHDVSIKAKSRALTPSKPSMPRGLSVDIGQSSQVGPGHNAATVVNATVAIPTSQAKGSQRLEGSRPSGNSSTKNTQIALNGTHTQALTHVAAWPPGRERGCANSA